MVASLILTLSSTSGGFDPRVRIRLQAGGICSPYVNMKFLRTIFANRVILVQRDQVSPILPTYCHRSGCRKSSDAFHVLLVKFPAENNLKFLHFATFDRKYRTGIVPFITTFFHELGSPLRVPYAFTVFHSPSRCVFRDKCPQSGGQSPTQIVSHQELACLFFGRYEHYSILAIIP